MNALSDRETEARKPKRTRIKRERRIKLVRPLFDDEPGIFCLTEKESTFYVFHEIPCDIGGRGFAVHRLGLGTLYHIRVGEAVDCSCECMGFLAHGRCKHVLGLLALIGHGML